MNVVKEIERINAKELELGGNSSWHDDYKDSAYIFVGGLDIELTEGDVVTIFSQYGEIADVNMPRDKKTNKPRGFAFLMYEDQRSTVLAVDNLSGASVVGRTLRVDHVNKYKQLEKNDEGKFVEREQQSLNAVPENFAEEGSDSDAASSHPSIDPDDPMASYLLEQARAKKRQKSSNSNKHAGESKEERRARREEKRQRKAAKKDRKEDGGHRHHHRHHHHGSSRRARDEEDEQDLRERDKRRRPSRGDDSDDGGSLRRHRRDRDDYDQEDRQRRDHHSSRRAPTRSRSPPPRFTSDRYRRG